MSEVNDSSSIKLFGKMIPLLALNLNQDESVETNLLSSSNSLGSVDSNYGVQAQPSMEDQEKYDDDDDDNSRIPLSERNSSSLESSKNVEKTETNGSEQQKTLKKPDKILPCPRCNSKDTKFCYYNNYNVNQPRHFCKNCQRYWTAGGSMRNVPVGAGRRKTKSSSPALHYHHVMISEAVNGLNQNEDNNSCVLSFGSNSSVFNLSPPPKTPAVAYHPCFPASFYTPPALPALGKHSREEIVKPSNSKAMRIDGTEISAKSSMIGELMIKTKNAMNSGGIFNGFQSKTSFDDDRNYRMRTVSVLQANPVAFSRSLNFHENT